MSDGVAAEKARLRERFRAARAGLAPEARASAARAVADRVASLPEWTAARVVALYWPVLARGELDVRPLLDAALAAGKRVALPVVAGASPPALVFRQAARQPDGAVGLVVGRWGLREPPDTAPLVEPAAIDLVVVPAFGAGREGGRIGHGGGFYDAFLPTTRAARVGVVYAACLVDAVPREPHDVRLDVVVTEADVVRPAAVR